MMVKEAEGCRAGAFGSSPSVQYAHFGEDMKPFHHGVPTEVHVPVRPDLPSWVTGRQGAGSQIVLHRLWHAAGGAWMVFHPCDGRKAWCLRCCREGEANVIRWSLSSALLHCPTRGPCALQLNGKGSMFWEGSLWGCKHTLASSLAAGVKSNHSQMQSWWERGMLRPHSLGLGWRSCPAGFSDRDLERGCPAKLKYSTAWKCVTTRWTGESCQQQEWQKEVGLFDLALGYW